jgi:hypothetical protein
MSGHDSTLTFILYRRRLGRNAATHLRRRLCHFDRFDCAQDRLREKSLSRPKGEIFLRSLTFVRDDNALSNPLQHGLLRERKRVRVRLLLGRKVGAMPTQFVRRRRTPARAQSKSNSDIPSR